MGALLLALDSMEGTETNGHGSDGRVSAPLDANASTNPFPPLPKGPINPSVLDSTDWVELGLSPKQARGAVRYVRSLGGQVSPSALERMRVLPEGWLDHYGSVLAFQALDAKEVRIVPDAKVVDHGRPSEPTMVSVDINRADSIELVAIRGVGPWVAGRILSARRKWGGIADLSLLTEALNGWDSLATAIAPAFHCSSSDVQRRCLDSLGVSGWASLPGVGWNEARALERRVRHHGTDVELVLNHPALDSVSRVVIAFYLKPCRVDG